MDNIIQKNAYLYQVRKGILNLYEGDVRITWKSWEGVFKTKNKNIACSSKPKIVFNGVVWLPEINDDLAIELLTQYEEAQITMLEKRIEIHRLKIEILKGE